MTVVEGVLRVWLGRVEIEVEALSPATTQEIRLQDRPHTERRRGLVYYAASLLAGVAAVLTLMLSNPGFWSPLSEDRWLSLAVSALASVIVMPVAAVVLLIVLKAMGRKVRFADAIAAIAGVAWLLPVVALLSVLGYYVLRPEAHAFADGLAAVGAAVVAIVWLVALITRAERAVPPRLGPRHRRPRRGHDLGLHLLLGAPRSALRRLPRPAPPAALDRPPREPRSPRRTGARRRGQSGGGGGRGSYEAEDRMSVLLTGSRPVPTVSPQARKSGDSAGTSPPPSRQASKKRPGWAADTGPAPRRDRNALPRPPTLPSPATMRSSGAFMRRRTVSPDSEGKRPPSVHARPRSRPRAPPAKAPCPLAPSPTRAPSSPTSTAGITGTLVAARHLPSCAPAAGSPRPPY